MATARPFAYNTGAPIAGTEQVGSLAVGYPTSGFVGLPWWNGPDEELGYVIAKSVPGNNQPVPVGTGKTGASVGFLRSPLLTESSFVDLANYVAAGATSWGPTGGTSINVRQRKRRLLLSGTPEKIDLELNEVFN